MQDQEFIRVDQLTKRYVRSEGGKGFLSLAGRTKVKVDGLVEASFSVHAGEIVGLLGPNGAGKSTTVKLLTGILTPDSGSCEVNGYVPWRDRKKYVATLGTVFGQRTQLWWDVPIRESYVLLRDIYRLPDDTWKRRLDELTEALSLSDLMQAPLRQLSLGQRMRAELCGALLHEPSILFLDEPTIGLDAVTKLNLRDFLRRENERRGTTILLTTHDMSDMLALCPRVLVLGHGKLLYDGALDPLLHRYDTRHTMRCSYEGEPRWEQVPDTVQLERDGDVWMLTFNPADVPADRALALAMGAGKLRELTLKEQDVDEMVAGLYRDMQLA